MKNLILKSVLFLSLTVALVSCSKDDAPAAEASLVGKWEITQETDDISGSLVPHEHATGCNKDQIEFTSTTVIDKSYENTQASACVEYVDSYAYTKSGNTLTVTENSTTFTSTILVLNATELRLQTGTYITVFRRM